MNGKKQSQKKLAKQIFSHGFKVVFIIVVFAILTESNVFRKFLHGFGISSEQFGMGALLILFTIYLITSYKRGYLFKRYGLGKIMKKEESLRYWVIMIIVFLMWLLLVICLFSPTWLIKIFP